MDRKIELLTEDSTDSSMDQGKSLGEVQSILQALIDSFLECDEHFAYIPTRPLKSTGVNSTGVNSTGVKSTGVKSNGVKSTGVKSSGYGRRLLENPYGDESTKFI